MACSARVIRPASRSCCPRSRPLVMCDVGANIRAQAGHSCSTASWPAPTPPRCGPRLGPRRAPVRRQEDLKGTPSSSTPRLCCALRPHQLRGQRRGTRPVPRELRRRHLRRLRGTIALSDEVSPRPVKTSRRKSPWPARAGRKLKPSSNASGQPRLRRVRWGPVEGRQRRCIICHGSSTHVAIRNAVRVATDYLDRDLNAIIAADLAEEAAAARPN